MKFGGGPYGYGPCPHIGGWKFGLGAPNMGEVLLVCPAPGHPPFPPACGLHMEFIFQLGVLIVLSIFRWGSSFSLLPVAVADTMGRIAVIIAMMIMVFMAISKIGVQVYVQS